MNDEHDDIELVENDEDGSEKAAGAKLKKLKEKIDALEKEKQEYLDGWQRARADYANLIKTSEEDKKRFKSLFAERFIEDLIPVIDSFQMAMSNKEAWEKVDAGWRSGVEYIYNQLINALSSHDLTLYGETGDVFDPAKYEAVSEEATDDAAKDHTVSKVSQKGFLLGDTVLRPARVTVFKGK
jgi:molecular chaperone GrpE